MNRIKCYLPDQFTPFEADVVLANILAQPLIDLSGQIAGLVGPGGHLVLSGILNEQAAAVADAYRPYIDLNTPTTQEDWCRLDGCRDH